MIHHLAKTLEIVAILGCASSCLYYLLCLWSAVAFLRNRRAQTGAVRSDSLPGISILKPLKGVDPEIYESFRSHCLQDYPEYQIIFGVSDPEDPAVPSARQLQQEFPKRDIQLIVCREKLGANVKVSNLDQMMSAVRYRYLIVNDSDIRVEPDYLRRVTAPLADPSVGMVTCLYRGVASPTTGSRLESLGIGTDFCAGVLAAQLLDRGIRFGLGSTLAFRHADLNRLGGFVSLVDYLADDYELGCRIADLGLKVLLSDAVVETHLPAYDLRGFLSHQLRWARGVRDSRLGGYIGLVTTFGLMWGLLTVVAARGAAWAWAALGTTLILRFAVAMTIGKSVLRDAQIPRLLWLLPVRDLIAVGVWIASFFGHTVTWRGDRFELKKGRLTRLE
jgi:ceramide glucosyltransferase